MTTRDTEKVGASTILEFCRAHRISRSFFYKLRDKGEAPSVMELGRKRIITDEAAAAWRRQHQDDGEE